MVISVRDIVPFSTARTHLSDLVLEVQNGAEKIITKNGEPAVAVIDIKRLDHYHRLERAHVHLLLLEDVDKGLADVKAGRTIDARAGLSALMKRKRRTATGGRDKD
ncbi:type II toxin-antitoxin system Phd/YefM family antitoxin [Variovorax sp. NFACC27]|uniref:Antitoxin n=1 Tax=Variovorax gossypii TaxID=1679495 RepID=A0A3S0GUF3_9BURK|nr:MULTISPECIES: type II toxin-antitoxin system Phd/YefM family antitoxin [Variovorax]SEF35211.1 prevent-host-death family protein [Variovorax sp. NFACC28]SEG98938.1 prevent-host-death family protein [Variovorax sp. NFACC29]SFE17269.1 prevent-host-death family protein [Variovorax sp. NFACC26]SFH21318.1 prevent-host-death family protein [Variovorax sp. NFACC27]RTQ33043.1 type II toxin-antitoxin system Phd/YefM family antitoxin [Variovorax gossypii]